jgi:hypothetical protein
MQDDGGYFFLMFDSKTGLTAFKQKLEISDPIELSQICISYP